MKRFASQIICKIMKTYRWVLTFVFGFNLVQKLVPANGVMNTQGGCGGCGEECECEGEEKKDDDCC